MDSVQTMSSSSLFCILLISYQINLVLIYWILPWKQNYSFSCVFFSETLITTVSKFIKTCNHTLVCLHLTDVELSHEGIIKCLFQFWTISDFSVSLTPYITFCVHCVPHHLFLVQPRLSSSHMPRVSLRNPKIKLRCQGSVVKVWDLWVTHHQAFSPKDFFTFCSTPQFHSSCTFCLPQMPRSPSESRHLPWFILEAAPPHTRKRKIWVQRLGWREIKNCIMKHPLRPGLFQLFTLISTQCSV